MNGSANVHSLEALRDWHAALCIFQTDASEALASIALEIQRAENWLDEQMNRWQRELREAEEDVVRAKMELSQRRYEDFGGRVPDCSVQEENLWQAEKKVQFIRSQIEIVRRWYNRMPKMVSEAYDAPSRHLMSFLEAELPRGIALLKNQIGSLESYLNLRAEHVAPPPPVTPSDPKK
jgi:hypothetical protein